MKLTATQSHILVRCHLDNTYWPTGAGEHAAARALVRAKLVRSSKDDGHLVVEPTKDCAGLSPEYGDSETGWSVVDDNGGRFWPAAPAKSDAAALAAAILGHGKWHQ